jgi:hypothetical protein
MFELSVKRAAVGLRSQEEIDAIIVRLAARDYKPVVRSMLAAGFEVGGLNPDPALFQRIVNGNRFEPDPSLLAEMFFGEHELYLVLPTSTKLSVWSLRHHDTPSNIDGFCDALADAARATLDGRRLRGMDFSWSTDEPNLDIRRRGWETRRGETLRSTAPNYEESDARRAEILSLADNRDFLLRLARVRGRARSADTAEGSVTAAQRLLDSGLLSKEYLVVCRQDSHTLCTVEDRERLTAAGAMKCTICGRPFAEELVQEIYAITDAGTKLLNGSHWMTIWVTELLRNAGLGLERIEWSSTGAEDEIDIVANICGRKIFFELKDREFGVGDAYPFLYRVERFGGSFGVVASTASIADEVKRVFMERRQPGGVERVPIETIESAEGIRTSLADVVDRFSRKTVDELMERAGNQLGFDLKPIVDNWMNSICEEIVLGAPSLARSRATILAAVKTPA